MNNNIDGLISGIFQPDFFEIIKDYSTFNEGKKIGSLLLILCNQSKNFSSKKNHRPYIQIKNDHKNFIYNDWLNVIVKTDRVKAFDNSVKEFHSDFICDSKNKHRAYFVISYQTSKGPLVNISEISCKDSFNDFHAFEFILLTREPLVKFVNYLIENGEEFPLEFSVSPNTLIHTYNETKKSWTIESPLDQISLSISPTENDY